MSLNFTDGRIAAGVSAGTTGSGLGTWLDLIPNEIGKLATLVGICLSLVLIVMHVRKMRHDAREAALTQELLIAQIEKIRAEK